MKNLAIALFASLLLFGCSKDKNDKDQSASAKPSSVEADNTGKNVRDRDGATKTPGDQSENEADRTITQNIRKAIEADDSLSTDAKNVKVITSDGKVTLRGPVKSDKEKADIAAKAKEVAGVKNVDNQIEIASK